MAKRCEVSVTGRREAVLSLLRREEAAAVIARRIGVSDVILHFRIDGEIAADHERHGGVRFLVSHRPGTRSREFESQGTFGVDSKSGRAVASGRRHGRD